MLTIVRSYAQMGEAFRLFLGVAEVLAVVALIVSGVIRRLTWLTPLAAAGLVIVMFVTYMRWKIRPLQAR